MSPSSIWQDRKSQYKNRDIGLRVLLSRLLEMKIAEQEAERAADRKGRVGNGDRSEKIRTYNFRPSRVTDHRIGLSVYSLNEVLNGDFDALIDRIIAHTQAEALQQGKSGDDAVN